MEKLNEYLRKRGIKDSDTNPPIACSAAEKLASISVEMETSRNNSILFSCPNRNMSQVDGDFTKLKTWVANMKNETYKKELSPLLFPVFFHYYSEVLITCGHAAAVAFYKRHASNFTEENAYKPVVHAMQDLKSLDDFTAKPHTAILKSVKYDAYLSPVVSSAFRHFIAHKLEAPTVLLKILTVWFRFHFPPGESSKDAVEGGPSRKKWIMGENPFEEEERTMKMELETLGSSDVESDGEEASENESKAKVVENNYFQMECDDVEDDDDEISIILKGMEMELKGEICRRCFRKMLPATGEGNDEGISCQSCRVGNVNEGDCDDVDDNIGLNAFQTFSRDIDSFLKLRNKFPKMRLYEIQHLDNVTCSRVDKILRLLAVGSSQNIHVYPTETGKLLPIGRSNALEFDAPGASLLEECDEIKYDSETVLRGHTGYVTGVKFMRQSHLLASVSIDCDMRSWRLEDMSCAALYKGHNEPIYAIDTSAEDMFMVTGSVDTTARLWQPCRTYPIRVFIGHTDDVMCVKFHPNAAYVATGSADKTVRLFDVSSAKSVRLFTGFNGIVSCCSFSPDGRLLAVGGLDRNVMIFDVATSKIFTTCIFEENQACELNWSPDSDRLFVTCLKKFVKIVDVVESSGESIKSDPVKYEVENAVFKSCQYDDGTLTAVVTCY